MWRDMELVKDGESGQVRMVIGGTVEARSEWAATAGWEGPLEDEAEQEMGRRAI